MHGLYRCALLAALASLLALIPLSASAGGPKRPHRHPKLVASHRPLRRTPDLAAYAKTRKPSASQRARLRDTAPGWRHNKRTGRRPPSVATRAVVRSKAATVRRNPPAVVRSRATAPTNAGPPRHPAQRAAGSRQGDMKR